MHARKLRHALKLWFFGPCGFPGGRCSAPGTKMFHPYSTSRPVWLCPVHETIVKQEERNE